MKFERKKYLNELIAGRGNGLVKIITGSDGVGSPSYCLTFGIVIPTPVSSLSVPCPCRQAQRQGRILYVGVS